MSPKFITLLISAVVITISMGAFVLWVRGPGAVPGPGPMSKGRAVVAFVVATMVLGTSMTLFGRSFGADAPLFAGILTMVTLGWTAFAHNVFPLRLPAGWRRLRPWERRQRYYRTWGVAGFGRFLRNSPLRHLNPAVYLSAGGPHQVAGQLEVAESVHFWGTVFTGPYLALCGIRGWWPAVGAILAVHVIANLYPLCHLRLARSRVGRLLEQKRSRVEAADQSGASAV